MARLKERYMDTASSEQSFRTESEIPVKPVYGPEDVAGLDYGRDLGDPGMPPYTRGAYPDMYRKRLWRISQLTGSGTSEEAGGRVQFAHEAGGDWIFLEMDQSSSIHYRDVDHPQVLCRKDDVGLSGAPLICLDDYRAALEGINLEEKYIHMAGIPFVHACYFAVAEERGIPLSRLRGTGQGEMFIPYLSAPFKDFVPPRCTLRSNCDLIEFHVKHVPNVIPISVAGHNARANGINAYQELAMVFANCIAYIEEVLRRGRLGIDDFGYAIGGVNFAVGRDFFEEIAKFRAGRRMWYKLMKERFHAQDHRSLNLRIHGFSADRSYTYQQPLVNIVRSTCRALAAALAGTQSLGIGPYDEAICVPSEQALLTAIRTHQILQHESGITKVADPLGGSYYLEWLTNELEERAWKYLEEIENVGGFIAALESGWFHKEAARAAVLEEARLASGDMKLVGVNCYQLEGEVFDIEPFRSNPRTWEIAMERLEKVRRERDSRQHQEAYDELHRVIASDENIMPAMMKAVKAGVTIGETGEMFRDVYGIWNTPIVF